MENVMHLCSVPRLRDLYSSTRQPICPIRPIIGKENCFEHYMDFSKDPQQPIKVSNYLGFIDFSYCVQNRFKMLPTGG